MTAATEQSNDNIEQQRDALVERFLHAITGLFDIFAIQIGNHFNFYRALARDGPLTPTVLAARTGTHERYVRAYHETEDYKRAMRKRKVWIEPLFGEAKQWHGVRQFRLRGLAKVNMEGLFIAAGQNLKRLLSAKGWGRRPWPDGAAGFADLRPIMSPIPT
jgi:hypothetical protein